MPVFKPVFIELTSVKKETHKTWKAKETTGKEEQKNMQICPYLIRGFLLQCEDMQPFILECLSAHTNKYTPHQQQQKQQQ